MNPTVMVSTGRAARFLGVSVGTVQKLVDAGLLSAGKTSGGHRRISWASLDAYRRKLFPLVPMRSMTWEQAEKDRLWRCAVASPSMVKLLKNLSTPTQMPVCGCTFVLEPMESLVHLAISPFDILFLDARLGWLGWPQVRELARARDVFVVLFNHTIYLKSDNAVALDMDMNLQSIRGYCAGMFVTHLKAVQAGNAQPPDQRTIPGTRRRSENRGQKRSSPP